MPDTGESNSPWWREFFGSEDGIPLSFFPSDDHTDFTRLTVEEVADGLKLSAEQRSRAAELLSAHETALAGAAEEVSDDQGNKHHHHDRQDG